MINIAREFHPDAVFYPVNNKLDNLPFAENSFDLVFSSGVFHLNKLWKQMLVNAYKLTKKYLLVDFRITQGLTQIGSMKLNYGTNAQDPPITEYIALNFKELQSAFNSLMPLPSSISIYGYNHPISDDAELDLKVVCMAFFLIEKGLRITNNKIQYSYELPAEFSSFFN